jgi:hypothetical protein
VLFALGCSLGLVPLLPAYAQQVRHTPTVKEIARSGGTVTLEITFPEPQFDTLKEGMSLLPYGGLTIETGEFSLPVALPKGSISIVQEEIAEMALSRPLVSQPQIFKPSDRSSYPAIEKPIGLALGDAKLEYIGKVSRADASRIRFGSFVYDRSASAVRYLKKITVRITASTLPTGKLTDITAAVRTAQSRRVQSGKQGSMIQGVKETQGIVSDDGKVHKFVIDRDGLYKLTYDDLKAYGLNPDDIDLPTLRMVHNGVQVPIYVFDKHDGRFSPGDYIEFWGERKLLKYESKFKDMYFDPYTRESIYYLVWGTQRSPIKQREIKRIVEESGEVREGDPTKYVDLKDSSFVSKLHFEEDNWFEFLSISFPRSAITGSPQRFAVAAAIRCGGKRPIPMRARTALFA